MPPIILAPRQKFRFAQPANSASKSVRMPRERVIARAIVANTDPPRVCLRKLPNWASLSPDDALSLSHRHARRDSFESGGHNVQTAYRNRCTTRTHLSVCCCPVRGRNNRPRATTARYGETKIVNRTQAGRRPKQSDHDGSRQHGVVCAYGAAPCCLDLEMALKSSNLPKVLDHDDRDD